VTDTQASASAVESQDREWARFMAQLQAAEGEFVRNRPAALKALWSSRDDVSICGAFGGIVCGHDEVARRLDQASAAFADGTRTREEISVVRGDDLAHVVQVESISYQPPGGRDHVTLSLRASMAFRRERGRWRIFHRHADPLLDVALPQQDQSPRYHQC
jgi:ketosteroid isomerase-like protein